MEPQSPRLKLIYTERARRDIAEIFDYIAQRNPTAAQHVEDEIRSTCAGLGFFPFASAETDEPRIRRIPVVRYPYTIFFRVVESGGIVEIARVVHAKRVRSLRAMPL